MRPATVVGGAHMLPFAAPECFVGIVSAFNGGEDIVRSCASGAEIDHGAKPSSQMCPVGPNNLRCGQNRPTAGPTGVAPDRFAASLVGPPEPPGRQARPLRSSDDPFA